MVPAGAGHAQAVSHRRFPGWWLCRGHAQAMRAVQVLASCPTTTRQDAQLLAEAGATASFRARCLVLALQWRMQYKRALARACQHAAACTAALAGE